MVAFFSSPEMSGTNEVALLYTTHAGSECKPQFGDPGNGRATGFDQAFRPATAPPEMVQITHNIRKCGGIPRTVIRKEASPREASGPTPSADCAPFPTAGRS